MNYQSKQYYKLSYHGEVLGMDGNKYINLLDGEGNSFTVKPFSYQSDWHDITTEVECFVDEIDIYGRPRFSLSKLAALNYWYQNMLGHYQTFMVERLATDPNTNATYYILSDCYGITQRFYPNSQEFVDKYKVGDEVNLEVVRIIAPAEGKNNARLELAIHTAPAQTVQPATAPSKPVLYDDPDVTSIGCEDMHTEFKSSIVFMASTSTADIEGQLAVIMRSLAGFMNKEGGTLYVGVNDAGEPARDVSKDYPYLNTDSTDNRQYQETFDQYKNKLINKVSRVLGGPYAASLVSIEEKVCAENGIHYAAINVAKADYPIWYEQTELYVRCDNSTRRFKGDAITKFILSRNVASNMSQAIDKPVIGTADENAVTVAPVAPTTAATPASDVPASTPPAATLKQPQFTTAASRLVAWRYLAFFDNGDWEFRKTMYSNRPTDLICEIPVPKNPKQWQLLLAYESGHVNGLELKDLLYGSGKKCNTLIADGKKYSKGLVPADRLVAAFCMQKKTDNLLVVYKEGCKLCVKVHSADVVTYRSQLQAQSGVCIIPTSEASLVGLAAITADSAQSAIIDGMGITVKNIYRYQCVGIEKSQLSGKYQGIIDSILKDVNSYGFLAELPTDSQQTVTLPNEAPLAEDTDFIGDEAANVGSTRDDNLDPNLVYTSCWKNKCSRLSISELENNAQYVLAIDYSESVVDAWFRLYEKDGKYGLFTSPRDFQQYPLYCKRLGPLFGYDKVFYYNYGANTVLDEFYRCQTVLGTDNGYLAIERKGLWDVFDLTNQGAYALVVEGASSFAEAEKLLVSEVSRTINPSQWIEIKSDEVISRRDTPDDIKSLKENQIFVFGSNLQGQHSGGASRVAVQKFGAKEGKGNGIQGQSYAIPTMNLSNNDIQNYVDQFIQFASEHREYEFFVTKIGCGIAGKKVEEIAPMFKNALWVNNIHLPREFWENIKTLCCSSNPKSVD